MSDQLTDAQARAMWRLGAIERGSLLKQCGYYWGAVCTSLEQAHALSALGMVEWEYDPGDFEISITDAGLAWLAANPAPKPPDHETMRREAFERVIANGLGGLCIDEPNPEPAQNGGE